MHRNGRRFYNLTWEGRATGLTLVDVMKNGQDASACCAFEAWRVLVCAGGSVTIAVPFTTIQCAARPYQSVNGNFCMIACTHSSGLASPVCTCTSGNTGFS